MGTVSRARSYSAAHCPGQDECVEAFSPISRSGGEIRDVPSIPNTKSLMSNTPPPPGRHHRRTPPPPVHPCRTPRGCRRGAPRPFDALVSAFEVLCALRRGLLLPLEACGPMEVRLSSSRSRQGLFFFFYRNHVTILIPVVWSRGGGLYGWDFQ